MKPKSLSFLVCLVGLLLTGCASPYQGQADALREAYYSGQISANDYHARMNELEGLDLQRRQGIATSLHNAGSSLQQGIQGMQRKRAGYTAPIPSNVNAGGGGHYVTVTDENGNTKTYWVEGN